MFIKRNAKASKNNMNYLEQYETKQLNIPAENEMSRLVGKPTICIGENKDTEADQRLCLRYSDSTIPLLLKSEISRV